MDLEHFFPPDVRQRLEMDGLGHFFPAFHSTYQHHRITISRRLPITANNLLQ